MAIQKGYILREEVDLLKKDIMSNLAAIDLGRRLGYSGGVFTADAELLKQDWAHLRTAINPQMLRWRQATRGAVDERFDSEALLSRAAASWQAFHANIPNGGGAVDGNVDLYIFDYILSNAVTVTWDIGIKIPTSDPIAFAREWSPHRHIFYDGPFVNRDFGDPQRFIWTMVDIPVLVALRPIASSKVDQIPVEPKDAQESLALSIYGNYVGEFTVDNVPNNLSYVVSPFALLDGTTQ